MKCKLCHKYIWCIFDASGRFNGVHEPCIERMGICWNWMRAEFTDKFGNTFRFGGE